MNLMTPTLCRRLSVLISITAVLTVLIAIQLSRQRVWLPTMPLSLGAWNASEVPLDRVTLAALGEAHAQGYRFTNPFGERVEVQIVATDTYAAYHDPPVCQPVFGNVKTAFKTMYVLGPAHPVQGLVIQNQNEGARMLMYYWVQYKDGSIGGADAPTLQQDGLPQRLAVGWDKTRHISPSCVVRLFTSINPDDNMGLQARRSLDEISGRVYATLKQEGAQENK